MFLGEEHLPQSPDRTRPPAGPAPSTRKLAGVDPNSEYPPFVLSNLQSLFRAPKLQPQHLQKLAHSLTRTENVTPAFPCTSSLPARSFAEVQLSTPLFSCTPALFAKNTREGVYPVLGNRCPGKPWERQSPDWRSQVLQLIRTVHRQLRPEISAGCPTRRFHVWGFSHQKQSRAAGPPLPKSGEVLR